MLQEHIRGNAFILCGLPLWYDGDMQYAMLPMT